MTLFSEYRRRYRRKSPHPHHEARARHVDPIPKKTNGMTISVALKYVFCNGVSRANTARFLHFRRQFGIRHRLNPVPVRISCVSHHLQTDTRRHDRLSPVRTLTAGAVIPQRGNRFSGALFGDRENEHPFSMVSSVSSSTLTSDCSRNHPAYVSLSAITRNP